jgi:hypothetical protein
MGLSRLFIGVALLAAAGCGHTENDAKLGSRIEAAISQSQRSGHPRLELTSLTPFSWDKVFVFSPYTSRDTINRTLGYHWSNSSADQLEWNDSFELLVFVRHGRVIAYSAVKRIICNWDISNDRGLDPAEAVFDVRQSPSGPVVCRQGTGEVGSKPPVNR